MWSFVVVGWQCSDCWLFCVLWILTSTASILFQVGMSFWHGCGVSCFLFARWDTHVDTCTSTWVTRCRAVTEENAQPWNTHPFFKNLTCCFYNIRLNLVVTKLLRCNSFMIAGSFLCASIKKKDVPLTACSLIQCSVDWWASIHL